MKPPLTSCRFSISALPKLSIVATEYGNGIAQAYEMLYKHEGITAHADMHNAIIASGVVSTYKVIETP